MNELIFLLHILLVISSILLALYIDKTALVAIIILQAVIANLFVIKQINLFGLNVTCSDVYVVGSVLGLNLLQEYYGKDIVKKTIWINFFILIFYLIMTQFQIFYLPSNFDYTHVHFVQILKFIPRITLASIIVFFIVQQLDRIFYSFLKYFFAGKYLALRNFISIFCTQIIDTVLFSFLGLYGIVESVWQIILVSSVIKILIILLATPFVSLSKKLVK